VAATAVSTGTPFEATPTPPAKTCAKEKRETAIVGGTLTAVFSILIAGLAATIYWMYKREKRQRRLKEHYEEQFSQTNAYRKALASSAGSCRGSVMMDDLKLMPSNPQ
jgi:NhaP-type Na+/H+ or K+/H+ antiporter